MTAVAAMITGARDAPLSRSTQAPLAFCPQRARRPSGLGGVIMWVPAGLVPLIAFTVVFFPMGRCRARRRRHAAVASAPS